MKPQTRHRFFTIDGIVSRALIAASRVTPEPLDIIVACGFGIVEMLGARRLWRIVWPAFKKQFMEQIHVYFKPAEIQHSKNNVDTGGTETKPSV